MLFVLLGVSIVILFGGAAFGIYLGDRKMSAGEGVVCTSVIIGILLFLCTIIAIIWNTVQVQDSFVIQDKIDMYIEQNNKIENEMSEMVEDYIKYEGQTFKDVTKDNAMQIAQFYPNLKSNELVKNNMELHQENIKNINNLKAQQINYKIAKWWLYFGN